MQSVRRLVPFIALCLAACPNNIAAPVAVAKGPAAANVGSVVQLTGSDSSDPQGRQLSYGWVMVNLPSGSKAALNDAHSVTPSFVVDVAGTYLAQLVVSNSFLASEPAQVTIVAADCGNKPPVAGAITATPQGGAAGATAKPGQTVTVAASFSDADSACVTAFAEKFTAELKLTARPAGSAAFLDQTSSALASVSAVATAHITPDVPGTYQVTVVFTDSTGLASAPAPVSFTVNNCGFNPPSVVFQQGAATVSSITITGTPATQRTLPAAIAVDLDNGAGCGGSQPVT